MRAYDIEFCVVHSPGPADAVVLGAGRAVFQDCDELLFMSR